MALWPAPPDAGPPVDLERITREVEGFARSQLPPWEAGYLEFHRRRYQDTLRLLPEGHGRRLLDIGSFPGHLSALAQMRGWQVTGLNNAIASSEPWAVFLGRCRERKIEILPCEVEREVFPAPTAGFDAALFCEVFEHLYLNPLHTLREIFRVLKPGGLLVLTTPNWRRAETLFRYLHDWGAGPPVSRAFPDLFPSLLYHRHNREYTASELVYYLAHQGKDLYDFRLDPVYYSDTLDGAHEIPGVLGQRVGRLEQALARLVRRCWRAARGQLMVRAWRSEAHLVEWSALGDVTGLGPLEVDEQPAQGFTQRLTFPFRWMESGAAFIVPLPPGEGPVLLSLMLAYLAAPDAPRAWTRWTLDGAPAMTLELPPSDARPLRLWLLVPEALAARGRVRVALHTTTALEPDRPYAHRLHLGGQGLLAERLGSVAAMEAAIARVAAAHRAEEGPGASWWHVAESLVVPHRVTRATLDMGPGDDAQLGPGWYHREEWGRVGTIRWSGVEAIAHLATDGQPTAVRVRAGSGDPQLGPVSGWLRVQHAAVGGPLERVGEVAFALAAGTWEELAAPVPRRPGRVRVTVRVEAPRLPRERIPGSQDDRPLGVAARRLWLA